MMPIIHVLQIYVSIHISDYDEFKTVFFHYCMNNHRPQLQECVKVGQVNMYIITFGGSMTPYTPLNNIANIHNIDILPTISLNIF